MYGKEILKSLTAYQQGKQISEVQKEFKLDKIISVLPGMRSPTVLPLAQEGWSSIHSVINKHEFWEVIDELKANGAEGILVCPIENMVI